MLLIRRALRSFGSESSARGGVGAGARIGRKRCDLGQFREPAAIRDDVGLSVGDGIGGRTATQRDKTADRRVAYRVRPGSERRVPTSENAVCTSDRACPPRLYGSSPGPIYAYNVVCLLWYAYNEDELGGGSRYMPIWCL